VKKGSDTLQKESVPSFGHAIMLRGIMDSELLLCPSLLQVELEFLSSILSPSVRM
jgi:hypothetical protein